MRKLVRKIICWAFPEIEKQQKELTEKYFETLGMHAFLVQENTKQLALCEKTKVLTEQLISSITPILKDCEVSVDVHEKPGSWAVISIQGKKKTFIKFIDLSDKQILEIANF